MEEDESSRKQAVDDLFARLRAERTRTDDGGGAGAEGSPDDQVLAASSGREPSSADKGPTPATGATPTPGPVEAATDPSTQPSVGEPGPDPRLAERDEMLTPVVSTLVRRLKRALQDDQNDILDRVRAGGGWGPDVLPSTEEHERRYVTAAIEHLGDAARSGATFVGGKPDDAPPVDAVAGELAAAIVFPCAAASTAPQARSMSGDDSALIEHVGAAFRDWKGGRVERLAGDEALAAFSQASLAAANHTTIPAVDRRRRRSAVSRLRRQRAGGPPQARRGVSHRAFLPPRARRVPLPPGSGRGVGSHPSALPARSVSPAASLRRAEGGSGSSSPSSF